jgi:hypothetical protein
MGHFVRHHLVTVTNNQLLNILQKCPIFIDYLKRFLLRVCMSVLLRIFELFCTAPYLGNCLPGLIKRMYCILMGKRGLGRIASRAIDDDEMRKIPML